MNAIQIDREKIQNILGIDFLCVKIDLSYKQLHRVIDDLRYIICYIIYTLTRIENVLIYVTHGYMHCGWTIYYFIKIIFGIWWSEKFRRHILFHCKNYNPTRSQIDFTDYELALYFSHSVTLMRYSMLSLSIR